MAEYAVWSKRAHRNKKVSMLMGTDLISASRDVSLTKAQILGFRIQIRQGFAHTHLLLAWGQAFSILTKLGQYILFTRPHNHSWSQHHFWYSGAAKGKSLLSAYRAAPASHPHRAISPPSCFWCVRRGLAHAWGTAGPRAACQSCWPCKLKG